MKDILDQHLVENETGFEHKNYRRYRILAIIQLLGSSVAVALAWSSIESIIGSGPILSILGFAVLFFASLIRNRFGIVLGLIPLFASCTSFCIIFFLSLSPNEARVPISSLLSFFLLISVMLGIVSLMRRN